MVFTVYLCSRGHVPWFSKYHRSNIMFVLNLDGLFTFIRSVSVVKKYLYVRKTKMSFNKRAPIPYMASCFCRSSYPNKRASWHRVSKINNVDKKYRVEVVTRTCDVGRHHRSIRSHRYWARGRPESLVKVSPFSHLNNFQSDKSTKKMPFVISKITAFSFDQFYNKLVFIDSKLWQPKIFKPEVCNLRKNTLWRSF